MLRDVRKRCPTGVEHHRKIFCGIIPQIFFKIPILRQLEICIYIIIVLLTRLCTGTNQRYSRCCAFRGEKVIAEFFAANLGIYSFKNRACFAMQFTRSLLLHYGACLFGLCALLVFVLCVGQLSLVIVPVELCKTLGVGGSGSDSCFCGSFPSKPTFTFVCFCLFFYVVLLVQWANVSSS